jgi:hypothetical protein
MIEERADYHLDERRVALDPSDPSQVAPTFRSAMGDLSL